MRFGKTAIPAALLAIAAVVFVCMTPAYARNAARKARPSPSKKHVRRAGKPSLKKSAKKKPPTPARVNAKPTPASWLASSGEAILDSYDGTDRTALDRAESYFREALETDPAFAPAYTGLSKAASYRCYRGGGEFDDRALTRALTLADKALELAPASGDAYLQRGFVLYYLESYSLALRQADKAEKLGVPASALYGEIAMKRGDLAEAERRFEAALSEAGGSAGKKADALDALGEIAMSQEDYETAIEMFKGASALRPNSSWESSNYGLALIQAGRLDEAIEILGYALKKHDFPEVRTNLALAYLKKGVFLHDSGEPARAKRCYQEALNFDPGLQPAYRNLAAIYDGEGDTERVRALCSGLLKREPDNAWARVTLDGLGGR